LKISDFRFTRLRRESSIVQDQPHDREADSTPKGRNLKSEIFTDSMTLPIHGLPAFESMAPEA